MRKIIVIVSVALASLLLGLWGGFILEKNTNFWNGLINSSDQSKWNPAFSLIQIKSPLDGELQNAYFYRSQSPTRQPLIVSLHSWSFDYRQEDTLALMSRAKDYNYIHPDFRGQNWTKNACCSDQALSDIDAAIDYALSNASIDTSKIFVIGRSGGGYASLALFMRSRHRIKKFSAWVPLADLVKWYEETRTRKLKYADNILVCTNSTDGKLNTQVAIQKSPQFWNTPVDKLNYSTLEIFCGVNDGLEGNGPIPITQSINFYNKLLRDLKANDSSKYISDSEKLKLLELRRPLGDFGKISGRDICLLKEFHNIKITIFSGGHEILSAFAFVDLVK